MAHRFDPEVERLLVTAGWYAGRDEAPIVDDWAVSFETKCGPMPEAARAILTEFGGLTIGERGPGIDNSKEQLEFDPSDAAFEANDYSPWIGPAYPLGDVAQGHGWLYAGVDGTIWTCYLNAVLCYEGQTIEEALSRILLGKKELRRIDLSREAPGRPGPISK